jgi:aminomethyltransferase
MTISCCWGRRHRRTPSGLDPLEGILQPDVTTAYAGVDLTGPRSEDLLRRVTALDVSHALPVGSCAETNLAGVHALLVRAAELAVPSVRIYVAWDVAEYLWERLLDAGRACGVVPIGIEGWRQLLAG